MSAHTPDPPSSQNPKAALSSERLSLESTLELLKTGEIEIIGQFTWSSNFTFLANVHSERAVLPAVYKPTRGERPLWDFPRGLAAREVAAFLTSRTLNWDLVPATVLRSDGPAGPGSVQLFIDADPERHYFTFNAQERQRLRPVVVFDILANNADRKGGHVLLTPQGKIHLIDHGLCFHEEYKLRTVLWDFVGEPIPADLMDDVDRFRNRLEGDTLTAAQFKRLLPPKEYGALLQRAASLLENRRFPAPGPGRHYPYPLV
jgi:uncharacterized repeat protein (TIGR03843 family)